MSADRDRSLSDLGIPPDRTAALLRGEAVAVALQTTGEPGVAILQLAGGRLAAGVVEIRDVGGGVRTLLRFRARCLRAAAALGCDELELFGAAVTNRRLADILVANGFVPREAECPAELGGGRMDILGRVYRVSDAQGAT